MVQVRLRVECSGATSYDPISAHTLLNGPKEEEEKKEGAKEEDRDRDGGWLGP